MFSGLVYGAEPQWGVRLGPCFCFSYPVGTQGHGSVSLAREEDSEGALPKAIRLNHHISEQTAGIAFVN